MQAQGGFREPEFASIKRRLKPKSGVVTEIDNRRLAKLQNWLVRQIKQGITKTPLTTKCKRRCIVYLFRNERRAEILDRLYEIRKEYYFNSIKRMKKYILLYPEMRT
jgi:hypothetical protein